MNIRHLIVLTTLAMLLVAFAPRPAEAHHLPETYCSDSGDICQSVARSEGPRKFTIILGSKLFKRYILCVDGPQPPIVCKTFRIKVWDDGTFGSAINFHRHFASSGEDRYRVSWYRVPKYGPPKDRIGRKLGFQIN